MLRRVCLHHASVEIKGQQRVHPAGGSLQLVVTGSRQRPALLQWVLQGAIQGSVMISRGLRNCQHGMDLEAWQVISQAEAEPWLQACAFHVCVPIQDSAEHPFLMFLSCVFTPQRTRSPLSQAGVNFWVAMIVVHRSVLC